MWFLSIWIYSVKSFRNQIAIEYLQVCTASMLSKSEILMSLNSKQKPICSSPILLRTFSTSLCKPFYEIGEETPTKHVSAVGTIWSVKWHNDSLCLHLPSFVFSGSYCLICTWILLAVEIWAMPVTYYKS